MKKICLMLIVIFCLTGCSSVVNIDIGNDKIMEEVVITADNENEYYKVKNSNVFPLTLYYDQKLNDPFNSKKEESGVKYYNVDSNIDEKKITISGDFNYNSHARSSVVRNCFKLYNVLKEDNLVTMSTSEGLICSYTNFKLNITTPYVVTSSNADSVDDSTNTYTWNFNKSNATSAYVNLKIDLSKIKNNYNGNFKNEAEQKSSNSGNILLIFLVMFVLLVIVSGIYIYKKYKNSDNL